MSLEAYYERNDIDPDREIADLSRAEAKKRVAERAYYKAQLSDSTYHGTNHNAKVNTITWAVKALPQFDHTDFEELDKAADQLIDERTA